MTSLRRFCFTLLFSGSAVARAGTWTVPGLANTPGRNGTFFVSELKLRNTGKTATLASFELLAFVGPSESPVSRTIAPGETLVLANALADLWGDGDRAGTVRVTAQGSLFIAARTFNDADPNGTYGVAIEPVPDEQLLLAGQTGHVGWVAQSDDPSSGYRTNVGVVLSVPSSSVDVVVLGSGGLELGRRTFTGGPLAAQVAVRDLAPSGDLSVARIEMRVTAGQATGFSAVNDNVTGDGLAIQPQRVVPGDWTDVTVNGSARAPGRFGTHFRTDARLVNPGGTARKVTVTGVGLKANGESLAATATLDVPAHAVQEIDDVLFVLFGAPDGTTGSIRFQADGPVLVLARTSNVLPDGSTFGSSQRPAAPYEYLAPGQTGTFVGLLDSGDVPGFRTNIGFTSGPGGAVVDLALFDQAGALVSSRTSAVSLPSSAFVQPSLADLFPGTPIPEQATLEVTPSDGTVNVYASFIDNGTGDSVIYRLLREPAERPESLSASSPCDANPGTAGLINEGTDLFRLTIDTQRYPDALCNDGTPGVFFVRKGRNASVNRWIVFLEGGGGCGTALGCQSRWCSIGTNFGAAKMTNAYAPVKGIAGGGILDDQSGSLFSDFSAVWIYYCSSDQWKGRARDRVLSDAGTGRTYTIHFLGARILDAVISELRAGVTYHDASGQPVTLPSLDDAEVVLLVGESAGGNGTKGNADRLGSYLARTNRTGHLAYGAVIDAADQPSNESYSGYEASERLGWAQDTIVYAGRVDESCVTLHPDDSWRCADSAHLSEHHITTPFFARTDLVDSLYIQSLGEPGWQFGTTSWEYGAATWDHLDRLTRLRSTAEEKADITVDPGLYGPHCDNHTALRNNPSFFVEKVARDPAPLSFYETLRNWLLDSGPKVVLEPRPAADPVPRSIVCVD